jgi:arylsulfatase A-like enzyme
MMNTRWKLVLGVAAALGLGGYVLWQQYWYYVPGLIQSIMDPVEANHPVVWANEPAAPASTVPVPPNVVLIVADDLGYNDITLNGGVSNGAVPTPNIDSIAKEGVNFSRSYSGNATCAPSRAAMMTGRFATRFGFEFTPTGLTHAKTIGSSEEAGPWPVIYHAENEANYPAVGDMQVPKSEVMITELLKTTGYRTLGVGKWHLGNSPTSRPEARGFDEYLGFNAATTLYLPANDANVVNAPNEHYPPDKFLWANLSHAVRFNGGKRFAPSKYVTDYFAEEAAAAVAANKNRPFFLYVGFSAPHLPLQALKSDYDSLGSISDHRLRVYGAMIKSLDRGVGTVLEALRANGLEENTIVIFTSDNGGAAAAALSEINRPLRGWKATFFDGGIRVPMFVKWPAKLQPAVVTSGAVGHVDIFATIAAAAGVAQPSDRKMDGVDLAHVAASGEVPDRVLYWRSGEYRALLHGDWKLQTVKRPEKTWLFNLKDDPGERSNAAEASSAELQRLMAELKVIDAEQAKPLWPSLIEAPVPLDGPIDGSYDKTDEHVYWAN